MAILITCECGKRLQTKDEHAGRSVRCPDCGRDLLVRPAGTGAPADPQPDTFQLAPAESEPSPLRSQPEPEPAARRPLPRRRRDEDEDDIAAERRPVQTSGKAVASLVLSLVSLCVPVVAGLLAILFGILSLVDISRSKGRLRGKGMAITGIVLSIVIMVLIFPISMGLLLPAIDKVRESANRTNSQSNLKQIGIATHNHVTAWNGQLPPAAIGDKNGKPLLSWRVALLPYLEEPGADDLYKEFHLDEPWDSPHNKALLGRIPRAYAPPGGPKGGFAPEGYTFYRVFVGPGTAFEPRPVAEVGPAAGKGYDPRSGRNIGRDFPKGTGSTWLVVEADEAVPWTKPDELSYSPNQPLPKLGGLSRNWYNVLFVDGSVQSFRKDELSDATLRNYITRGGK